MLVKIALLMSLAGLSLLAPSTAASDRQSGFTAEVTIDTSACPGLASAGSGSSMQALGTLTVTQHDPESSAFDLNATFRGETADAGDGNTFMVVFSGSIRGAPSAEVLGVGTLVLMGHGHGLVARDVPLVAFGPIAFDMGDAGSVQCIR